MSHIFLLIFVAFIPILVDGHENFLRLINPKVCGEKGELKECTCYDKAKDQCCNGLCPYPLICMSDGTGECDCVMPTCPEISSIIIGYGGVINEATCENAFCPDESGEIDTTRICKPNDEGTKCTCSTINCEERAITDCGLSTCPITRESCVENGGVCQCLAVCSDNLDPDTCSSYFCPNEVDKTCQQVSGFCTCAQGTCTDFTEDCESHTCLEQPTKNCVFRDGDPTCSCAPCVCDASTCNDDDPQTADTCDDVTQTEECECANLPISCCSICDDENEDTNDYCFDNEGQCTCTHSFKQCEQTTPPDCPGDCLGSEPRINATSRNFRCVQDSSTTCSCFFEEDLCEFDGGVIQGKKTTRTCDELICPFKAGSTTRNFCTSEADTCTCGNGN